MPKPTAKGARSSASIAREALLDIKFRRQSRIGFTNALRTTRSTCQRWIGFSLAPRSLGGGDRRRCDQQYCQKKVKKKLVIRSNI
jgi:hypothetical protein